MPLHLRGNASAEAPARAIRWYVKLGIPFHVCGSEGSLSRDYVEGLGLDGVTYVEVPQRRLVTNGGGDRVLRRKFNDSISTHGRGYDWYFLVGADDIVRPDVFRRGIVDEPAMFGIHSNQLLIVCDLRSRERHLAFRLDLFYRHRMMLMPGVNGFNRAAMELCRWRPYRGRGCETGAERYFMRKARVMGQLGFVIMLKEPGVLNDMDHLLSRHEAHPLNEWERGLLDEVLRETDPGASGQQKSPADTGRAQTDPGAQGQKM